MSWLDSHTWSENIPSPISHAELDAFQRKLDGVVGVEADGTKRWRIVWGQDFERTMIWDRYRKERRPRYAWDFKTDYVNENGVEKPVHTWIGVPRYFIEALIPDVHRDWEFERAFTDYDGAVVVREDKVLGFDERAAAEPGAELVKFGGVDVDARRLYGPDYMTLTPICEHSQAFTLSGWRICCYNRMLDGRKCLGSYRPPDDKDIEFLAEEWEKRIREDPHPNEPLTLEHKRRLAARETYGEIATQLAIEKAFKHETEMRLRREAEEIVKFYRINPNAEPPALAALRRGIVEN